MQNEYEMSCFNMDEANIDGQRQRFELYKQVDSIPSNVQQTLPKAQNSTLKYASVAALCPEFIWIVSPFCWLKAARSVYSS